MVGRLRPGATDGGAARELDSISAHAEGRKTAPPFQALVTPPSGLTRFQDTLKLLAAAVAMVLIIACANVAHLLLARGATRQREMAIRAAVGAGRARMMRQLLTESLVLAAGGGVVGMLVGWGALRTLVALRPNSLSQLSTAHMDGRTLLVAAGLAGITGIVFGVIGAMQASRLSSPEILRVGVPTSLGPAHDRLRSLLVVTEMALSTALLVGAALFIRSVANLQMTDPGFRADGLYSVDVNLAATSDTTTDRRWNFFGRIAEQAKALPGVDGVTLATAAPPGQSFSIGNLQTDDQPLPPDGSSFISVLGVHPEYFGVMGIRIVQGTTFTDTTAAAGQVIINEGMARKFWPAGSAVGHRLRVEMGGHGDWLTVVGVATNAATGGLTMEASEPMLYEAPSTWFSPVLIVRTSRPTTVLPAIRHMIESANAAIPPANINSITDAMMSTIALPRFTMRLLAVFTGLALVLAAVGLYGVMAYGVTQRTREIGIRIALGATAGNIARSVLGRGLALVLVGMVLGLVAANWGTQLIAKMLTGVTTRDPASFAVAACVLMATAAIASVVPMRRPMQVEPVVAMRAD
ncbi:MAG TPA: FtsX-like permease family protein [Gemmatimonadaceae bacterium]